jgi:hypothetical protein
MTRVINKRLFLRFKSSGFIFTGGKNKKDEDLPPDFFQKCREYAGTIIRQREPGGDFSSISHDRNVG